MRTLILAAALLLGSCGQQQADRQTAACTMEETHEVTWSTDGAADVISARADGPSCQQAFVTLSIRNAQGDPLWVFAGTYHDLTVGGIAPLDAPAVTPVAMETFLSNWARMTELRSSALPEWRQGMARPGEGVAPFGYETPFDREIYEAIRLRDLRTLCYAAAVAAVQCLVIDPASNAPTLIVAYGS